MYLCVVQCSTYLMVYVSGEIVCSFNFSFSKLDCKHSVMKSLVCGCSSIQQQKQPQSLD